MQLRVAVALPVLLAWPAFALVAETRAGQGATAELVPFLEAASSLKAANSAKVPSRTPLKAAGTANPQLAGAPKERPNDAQETNAVSKAKRTSPGVQTNRAAPLALSLKSVGGITVNQELRSAHTHQYDMRMHRLVDPGTDLSAYADRTYSVKECKALCNAHPACRSFTFRATRSCVLHDKCVSEADASVSQASPDHLDRTFYRSCREEGVPYLSLASSDVIKLATAEPLFLFVGVVTAPGYFLRREFIRKAWMRNPDIGPGRQVEVKFFVGTPEPGKAAALDQEISEHGDIVVLPVEDNYDNLTGKTLELLRWAVFYKRSKFVMKLDDDTYPNFHNLLPILRDSKETYSLHGHIFACAPVLNFTKWAEKKSVFNQPFYPTYAQGSGYILSYELAKDIGVTRYQDHKLTMLHNEDASVGLWIRRDKLVDIDLKDVVFKDLAARSTLYGCRENDVLSMNLQKQQMPCMWEKEASGARGVCCPETFRHDYHKEAGDLVPYSEAAAHVSEELRRFATKVGPAGIPVNMLQLEVSANTIANKGKFDVKGGEALGCYNP